MFRKKGWKSKVEMLRFLRFRIFLIVMAMAILFAAVAAIAAANAVPVSGLADKSRAITQNALKQPECTPMNMTSVVSGGGTITGIGENDLILGSSAADFINARNGADCVLG